MIAATFEDYLDYLDKFLLQFLIKSSGSNVATGDYAVTDIESPGNFCLSDSIKRL